MEKNEREVEGREESKRIEEYSIKEQQSRLYKEQEKECHIWLAQNLNQGKTASIMTMMEQMVETRSWKEARGLVEDVNCRICRNFSETVEHLVAGCTKLANREYLNRHNRALMVLAVTWAKQQELIGQDAIWYEQ